MRKTGLSVVLTSLISMIALGTILFHSLEDWTWITSFYFTVVTLTTVGYGDITPTTDESRLAASLFILIGVSIVVSALSIVGSSYISRQQKRRRKK